MGKKRQTASQPLLSPVYVNFGDRWFPIRGMQKLFGFLAYPPLPARHPQARDVERLRNAFMGTIEVEAMRSYINAGGSVEMARKAVPLATKKALGVRGKRVIEGGFNYGFKDRIAMRRVLAAMAALPTLVHAGVVQSVEKTGNERPQTGDKALHVLLDAKLDGKYPQWRTCGRDWYNRQFQDFKKLVWYETLPVLHLAIALCLTMRRYQCELSIPEKNSPVLYVLLKDPRWLCGTLNYADTKIRPVLHEFFPEFDPATAVQIIPVIPVSTPTFNPTLRY